MALSAIMGTAPEQAPNIGALIGQGFSQGFLPRFEKGLEQGQQRANLPRLAESLLPITGGNKQQAMALATTMQQNPQMAKEMLKQMSNMQFYQSLTGQQPGAQPPLQTPTGQPSLAAQIGMDEGQVQPNIAQEPGQLAPAIGQGGSILGAPDPARAMDLFKMKREEEWRKEDKIDAAHEAGMKDYREYEKKAEAALKAEPIVAKLRAISNLQVGTPAYEAALRSLEKFTGIDLTAARTDLAQLYESLMVYVMPLVVPSGQGVLTNAKLKIIMDKLPELVRSPAARDEILRTLEMSVQDAVNPLRLADQIIANNQGMSPRNLKTRVNQLYNEERGERLKEEEKRFNEAILGMDKPKGKKKGQQAAKPREEVAIVEEFSQVPLYQPHVSDTGEVVVRVEGKEEPTVIAQKDATTFTYRGRTYRKNPRTNEWM